MPPSAERLFSLSLSLSLGHVLAYSISSVAMHSTALHSRPNPSLGRTNGSTPLDHPAAATGRLTSRSAQDPLVTAGAFISPFPTPAMQSIGLHDGPASRTHVTAATSAAQPPISDVRTRQSSPNVFHASFCVLTALIRLNNLARFHTMATHLPTCCCLLLVSHWVLCLHQAATHLL